MNGRELRLSAGLLERVAAGAAGEDPGEDARRSYEILRSLEEQATLAFFEAYAARAQVAPGALAYFWSHSIVFTLLRALEKDHPKWRKRLAFYRAEFDAVPQRSDSLLRLGAPGAVA